MGGAILQQSFEQVLSGQYASLSIKLREAADYVVANPLDVATRSLRAVSKDADLSPATFSRMSAALGYRSYEDLRNTLRRTMQARTQGFAPGGKSRNGSQTRDDVSFLDAHAAACAHNLFTLGDAIGPDTIDACMARLHAADQVIVSGQLGSTSIAEHLVYMARYVSNAWRVAPEAGASLASGLVGLGPSDAVIVITKPPFAARSVAAAREAQRRGAFVIVITDTHTCPALAHASQHFILPSDSPNFFYSSYASTLVLCEIMIGMLAARAGPSGRARIAEVENANRSLSEVWGS